jgi:hypothetical protein
MTSNPTPVPIANLRAGLALMTVRAGVQARAHRLRTTIYVWVTSTLGLTVTVSYALAGGAHSAWLVDLALLTALLAVVLMDTVAQHNRARLVLRKPGERPGGRSEVVIDLENGLDVAHVVSLMEHGGLTWRGRLWIGPLRDSAADGWSCRQTMWTGPQVLDALADSGALAYATPESTELADRLIDTFMPPVTLTAADRVDLRKLRTDDATPGAQL